LNIVLSLDCTA